MNPNGSSLKVSDVRMISNQNINNHTNGLSCWRTLISQLKYCIGLCNTYLGVRLCSPIRLSVIILINMEHSRNARGRSLGYLFYGECQEHVEIYCEVIEGGSRDKMKQEWPNIVYEARKSRVR